MKQTLKDLNTVYQQLHNRPQYAGACLSVKQGREGPLHDPYGYKEIRIHRFLVDGNFHAFTLHEGLSTWLKVNDREYLYFPEKLMRDIFEELTGINLKKINRIEARIHGPYNKCPACGNRNLHYSEGYVGETMQSCPVEKGGCGEVLWSEDPAPYIV